jgi:hypothetical protein
VADPVPNGPGRLGPGAASGPLAPGPIAPTHRPRWLLVLSAVTLMYGGMLLISGLGDLRSPTATANLPMARPMAPQEEALTRELIEVNTAIVARHARPIRGRAAASTALALLLLYSAAAVLSRDRHGRTATLIAAWLGIAYWLGSLPVVMPIARDYAASSAPVFARVIALDLPALVADAGTAAAGDAGSVLAAPAPASPAPAANGGAAGTPAGSASGEAPPRPEAVAGFMQSVFIGAPIVITSVGILVSLLLITYFGGRRGRALYGLPPRHPPPRR